MQIGHIKQGRPEWYDRTPLSVVSNNRNFYNTNKLATTSVVYTVPSHRKFFLQHGSLELWCDVALAGQGFILDMMLNMTPFLHAESATAQLGDHDDQAVNGQCTFLAGEEIESRVTGYGGAGGDFLTVIIMYGLEFDE